MSVHDTGDGWIVRWRMGSKQPSRKFKRADGFTRADAEEFDRSMKRRKRMGGVDPLASERDFRRVVEEWWRSHYLEVSPGTRDKQRSYLENRILPYFEGYRLCDVQAPEVDAFRLSMEQAGVGGPTQRKVLYVLSGVMAYAQRMGYRTDNPVSAIKKPSGDRLRLIQPFPPEKVEEVRRWFLERGDIDGATMVSVLAYSGPRPAEAHARLTWADIGQSSIIYRGDKTERDRAVRLLGPLADDLKQWRQVCGVAVGQVFGWSESQFDEWRRGDRPGGFGQAARECGLMPARPYDLRHAFATLLAGEGRGIDYIARQLGHSVASCEKHYRHLVEDVDTPQGAEERIYVARGVPSEFLGQAAPGVS